MDMSAVTSSISAGIMCLIWWDIRTIRTEFKGLETKCSEKRSVINDRQHNLDTRVAVLEDRGAKK